MENQLQFEKSPYLLQHKSNDGIPRPLDNTREHFEHSTLSLRILCSLLLIDAQFVSQLFLNSPENKSCAIFLNKNEE